MPRAQTEGLSLRSAFKTAGLPGKAALVWSTWFGVGSLPKMPGTFASLSALPLVILLDGMRAGYRGLFLVAFILAALWACEAGRQVLGREDPREIVVDEVAGMLFATFLLPLSWPVLIAGFILFRFFDIVKIPPVSNLEKVRGGAGILLDDLMAGVYANILLRLSLFFLQGG